MAGFSYYLPPDTASTPTVAITAARQNMISSAPAVIAGKRYGFLSIMRRAIRSAEDSSAVICGAGSASANWIRASRSSSKVRIRSGVRLKLKSSTLVLPKRVSRQAPGRKH